MEEHIRALFLIHLSSKLNRVRLLLSTNTHLCYGRQLLYNWTRKPIFPLVAQRRRKSNPERTLQRSKDLRHFWIITLRFICSCLSNNQAPVTSPFPTPLFCSSLRKGEPGTHCSELQLPKGSTQHLAAHSGDVGDSPETRAEDQHCAKVLSYHLSRLFQWRKKKKKSSGFQFWESENQERFMNRELWKEIILCIIRWAIHNKTPPNCIQIELEKNQHLWVTFATRGKRSQTWCVPFHTLFWDFKILFLSVERFFLNFTFA